ncbi:MAG: hypothetical protein SYC29_01830 [Planctomycetota bacterium]|nr:hypothetical protein [Planctomycetota bacterium]
MRVPAIATTLSLPRWAAPLPRLAVGGAWLFIVFSLAHLAWVVAVKWGDPAGVTTLYQTTVGEETFRAWGLAYAGTLGLLLALAEAAAVGAGVAMSLRARPKIRRIGHLILIAWSALWALNLLRLASLDLQLDTTCQAMAMIAFFGCTVYRAALPEARRGAATPVEARAPAGKERVIVQQTSLTSRHVTSTSQVKEITRTVREKHRSPAALASRLGAMTGRLGRAMKPAARSVGRSLAAGGRRIRHYLRDKGVIPHSTRSSRA